MSAVTPAEHGGLVEAGPEVGAGAAAGQHRGALRDGVVDVPLHPLQLRRRDQRAHVGRVGQVAAQPQLPGPRDEAVDELVVHAVDGVDALDRDAQLAGVVEAVAHRTLGGLLEVGVGQHQHGVLAAELERAADQPAGAALGELAAGRRRAGEADEVAAVDDRAADRPGPSPTTICHKSAGSPASTGAPAPTARSARSGCRACARHALPAMKAGIASLTARVSG